MSWYVAVACSEWRVRRFMLESRNINVLCFLQRVLDRRVSSRVVNRVICSEWLVFLGGVVDLYTVERTRECVDHGH